MKYTYKDWLKGKIHRDYKNGLIPELKDVLITKGMLAESVYQHSRFSDSPDYLSKAEYLKIREAQREAFYKGVESQVAFELNKIKNGLNGIGEAEFKEAVQVEIETCEETYKTFDINKRKAVNRREPAFYGIDHNYYKLITQQMKPGAFLLSFSYHDVEGNPAFNEWFNIAVNREFKKQLSELTYMKPSKDKIMLTDKAIKKIEEYAEEEPDMPIEDFFRTAYNRYSECRTGLKNGKAKSMSFGTLRNRIEEARPDLYYRNVEKRKK